MVVGSLGVVQYLFEDNIILRDAKVVLKTKVKAPKDCSSIPVNGIL